MTSPAGAYADSPPGWYLRQLADRVRQDVDLARTPPAADDPGLPASARPLLARVVEHLEWCVQKLDEAAAQAGPQA